MIPAYLRYAIIVGSEMKKARPCVVLSPDEMNKYLQTIVVAPMTSSSKPYPTRVEVEHQTKKGWTAVDQIRTVDRARIIKRLGALDDNEIGQTKKVIKEMLVD